MSETIEELEAIIEHLEESRTVWRNVVRFGHFESDGTPNIRTHDARWPNVSSTFFYKVRANTARRLYMWGESIRNATYMTQPIFPNVGVANSIENLSAASDAAFAEAFAPQPTPAFYSAFSRDARVPNTEEFFIRGAVHDPLQDVKYIASYSNEYQLVCDDQGRLYVRGVEDLTQQGPRITGSGNTNADNQNRLGLGPRNPEFDTSSPLETTPGMQWTTNSGPTNASRDRQYSLQRIYGDNTTFATTRFVKTQASFDVSAALDADGYIWLSGNATGISGENDFPEDPSSSRRFNYFRRQVVSDWIDIHGDPQTSTLTFKDFILSSGSGRILALTHDGRLFGVGDSVYGHNAGDGNVNLTKYRQTAYGFIDDIWPVTNQIFPSSSVTITISAPPAGGVTAEAVPIMRRISTSPTQWILFGVKLTQVGRGYTSPPTVTVAWTDGTPQTSTDFVESTVFEGSWKYLDATEFSNVALISEDGEVYDRIYNKYFQESSYGTVTNLHTNLNLQGVNVDGSFPQRIVQFRQANESRQQQPAVFEKTLGARGFGRLALDENGSLWYWGINVNTPDGIQARHLTEWPTGTYIDFSRTTRGVFAVIDSSNDIYTFGRKSAALGHGSASGTDNTAVTNYRSITKVIGNAKWSRVFGSLGRISFSDADVFFAVRLPEELDEYGVRKNPLPPYEAPAP